MYAISCIPTLSFYHYKRYRKYECSKCTGNVPYHVLKDVDAYKTSNNNEVLRCKIITELEEENQLKTRNLKKRHAAERHIS